MREETSEIRTSPALPKSAFCSLKLERAAREALGSRQEADIGSALLPDCGASGESSLSPTVTVGKRMLSLLSPSRRENALAARPSL